MLVTSNVRDDARVRREAVDLVGAGHAVHVIGRDVPDAWEPPPGVSVSSVGGHSAFGTQSHERASGRDPFRRTARWVLLPRHRNSVFGSWAAGAYDDARRREFEVVHAHDFTALELAARLATERDVPYIYDTHEYWAGRPRVGRPTPAQNRHERSIERDLGTRAAVVITVGQGVADALTSDYGWSNVVVVRNSFPARMSGTLDEVPLSAEPTRLVYPGRLGPYRELEVIAAAAPRLALPVTLVGPSDPTWLASFDSGDIDVREPLDDDGVDRLLRESGIALVTHSNRWPNHRLALPNKLFAAVHAGVPVVATDVPELRRVVSENDLGVLYRPGDPGSLTAATRMLTDNYAHFAAAVADAGPALSWEADSRALRTAYDEVST